MKIRKPPQQPAAALAAGEHELQPRRGREQLLHHEQRAAAETVNGTHCE